MSRSLTLAEKQECLQALQKLLLGKLDEVLCIRNSVREEIAKETQKLLRKDCASDPARRELIRLEEMAAATEYSLRCVLRDLHDLAGLPRMDGVAEGALVLVAEQEGVVDVNEDEAPVSHEVMYLIIAGCAGRNVTLNGKPVVPVHPRASRIQALTGKKAGDVVTFRNLDAKDDNDIATITILAVI